MKNYPRKDIKDYGHDSVKVGLNAVPFVGGSLASVFETVFSSPINKRKEAWLRELAGTVDELCKQVEGLTPEKLSLNDEFVSIYLQASNIAIRTHHEEKIKVLRSAVKNTVLIDDYSESKKMIFIKVIDEMTPLHFKVLQFLSDPSYYITKLNKKRSPNVQVNWGDIRNVWDETYKDVSSSDPLIDIIVSDLNRYGFIFIDKFHTASLNSVSTKTGKQFLIFISDDGSNITD